MAATNRLVYSAKLNTGPQNVGFFQRPSQWLRTNTNSNVKIIITWANQKNLKNMTLSGHALKTTTDFLEAL